MTKKENTIETIELVRSFIDLLTVPEQNRSNPDYTRDLISFGEHFSTFLIEHDLLDLEDMKTLKKDLSEAVIQAL